LERHVAKVDLARKTGRSRDRELRVQRVTGFRIDEPLGAARPGKPDTDLT
jgi:hypothetical protein